MPCFLNKGSVWALYGPEEISLVAFFCLKKRSLKLLSAEQHPNVYSVNNMTMKNEYYNAFKDFGVNICLADLMKYSALDNFFDTVYIEFYT
jgi:hypothetical protein